MDRRETEADSEKKEEARNATHQMMNLLYTLCFQGYIDLHPSITEPGPYQDSNFQVPIAAGGGAEWEWEPFGVVGREVMVCVGVPCASLCVL